MNPTRELITDLLPAYFSGEASADTRAVVEEFFAQDPEFERMARRLAEGFHAFKQPVPHRKEEEDAMETRTLMRTRMALRGQSMSLGVAMTAVVALVLVVAVGDKHSGTNGVYPFIVLVIVACVAVFALLANRTRNVGL